MIEQIRKRLEAFGYGTLRAMRLHRSEVKDGTVTVFTEEPYGRAIVKREWRDEKDRRCTQYLAEVHVQAKDPEEYWPLAQAFAAAPDDIRWLLDRLDRVSGKLAQISKTVEVGQVADPLGAILAVREIVKE